LANTPPFRSQDTFFPCNLEVFFQPVFCGIKWQGSDISQLELMFLGLNRSVDESCSSVTKPIASNGAGRFVKKEQLTRNALHRRLLNHKVTVLEIEVSE
jgi:hypothetical protein